MINYFKKNVKFVYFFIIMISLALLYKSNIRHENEEVNPLILNKEIVNLWLIDDGTTGTVSYLIDEFNKNNNNIYIKLNVYKDDYNNILKTSIINKNNVDIAQYGFYQLFTKDHLLNLKDAGLYNEIHKDYYYYYDGEPYGIKIYGSTIKLMWNKEILKHVGIDEDVNIKSWAELKEICINIKEKYPAISPLEISLSNKNEIKQLIGEFSSNADDKLYSSFWSYKDGKYNLQNTKEILSIYKDFYSQGLMKINFDEKQNKLLKNNFANEETAFLIATLEDKNYFEGSVPLNFSIGINELPKTNTHDDDKFYYVNTKFLVLNSDIKMSNEDIDMNNKEVHFNAVKEVMNYLTSESYNSTIYNANKHLPILYENKEKVDSKYSEFYNNKNFLNEIYDPTDFVTLDSKSILSIFKNIITNKIDIDYGVNELQKIYNQALEKSKNYGDINPLYYKEQN